MSNQEYSADTFFGKYEHIIRQQLGKELDGFKKQLQDIGYQCWTKLFNLEYGGQFLTTEDILKLDSQQRCKILSALIYDDALWRLESAYLSISIGLLNIAYANMRGSLEAVIDAFIVERIDAEAIKFLKQGKVNRTLIEKYISHEQSEVLRKMKKVLSGWGVHTCFESVQLTSLFGPGRFNKIATEVPKVNKTLQLPDGFVDRASMCIRHGQDIGIEFMWLISKSVSK